MGGISVLVFIAGFFFVMFIGFSFGIGMWLAKKVVYNDNLGDGVKKIARTESEEELKLLNKLGIPPKETKEGKSEII